MVAYVFSNGWVRTDQSIYPLTSDHGGFPAPAGTAERLHAHGWTVPADPEREVEQHRAYEGRPDEAIPDAELIRRLWLPSAPIAVIAKASCLGFLMLFEPIPLDGFEQRVTELRRRKTRCLIPFT